MTYKRVLPRDLFNESKLLKCLGTLTIEGEAYSLVTDFWEHASTSFDIEQRPEDGGLYVKNLEVETAKGKLLSLYTVYNSKEPYPLYCETEDDTIAVFNDNGTLTKDFIKYIKG